MAERHFNASRSIWWWIITGRWHSKIEVAAGWCRIGGMTPTPLFELTAAESMFAPFHDPAVAATADRVP